MVRVSRITDRFGSPWRWWKIEAPPMPSRGLRMMSRCSAANSRRMSTRRLTRVGGVQCGNCVANSFSLQSRRLCGRFTTSNPSRSACSSRWVQ
ncbi:hypothetical protein D3C75_1203710 [compost metagenome]